jgi:uncharacterized protein YhjY with autotransporter beta-barrel domain
VSIEGEASAKSTSTAKSTATGINSGAGNDVVINSGNITAETGAAAAGLSIALGLKAGQSGESGGTTPQAAESSKSASKSTAETSVTAEATAAGIIGDGGEGTSSKQTTLGIQVDVNNVAGGINLSHGENKAGATGNDAITSSANITVLANSVSAAGSGAVSIEGDVSAKATSTAKSTATGIDAGAGNDVVTNSGNIIAAAAAGAAGLSIQVSLESDSSGPSGGGSTGTTQSTITDNQRRRETRGQSIGSDTSTTQSIFDLFSSGPAITAEASVNAEATAAGILGDSGEGTSNKQTVLGIQIDVNNAAGSITFGHSENKTGATGNDTINNTANITVLANSASAAGAGAVTLQGDASAKATSTAKSTATGIDAGAGNDVVTNSGNIIAEAGAGAAGLSVQVSLESDSGDSTGGGSTSATQSIIADNQRSRGTRSQASGSDQSTAQSIRDLFSSDSQAAAEASVTAEATAAGIVGDSGEGTSSKQTSLGIQVDVGNATGGISLSHIESKAAARGNDTITNSANITALANSASAAGAASISLQGDASAKATSTAKSTATGIDAGAGNDIITNSGTIVAEAGALAGGLSIGLGLQSGEGGGSTTTQAADINMESKKSSAETSVTAEATAAGILGDSGEGTSSKQTTLGIQVDVANATGAISFSHSENKAGATGNDTITNSANITVLANAASAAGSGAVSFEGDASAKATSTAKSTATGIDAGAGNDVVTNSGNIIAQAGAVAAGLTVAVGIASSESGSSSDSSGASQVAADAGTDSKKSSAETSVIASATAAGVLGDSGEGTSSRQTTLGIQVDINNLTGGIHLSHSQSNVAASGNDNIVNDGRIDVVAVAASAAGAVAIGIDGEASVKSTSEAKSLATGIGAGAGDDSVTNKGDMTATAVSAAGALSIAITTKGGARAIGGIWDSGSEAEATAVGIAGDSAEKNSSLAFSIDVDFSAPSANFAFQKKEGTVSGADTIRNEGSITTTAVAEAPAVNVAIASSEGMATAISSASAQARSSAIDAGGGKDEIFNSGELTSTAVANANAISVSVAGKGTALAGDAIWSGGAKSTATAKGIDGDGEGSSKTTEITASVGTDGVNAAFRRAEGGAVGNDTITNQGSITATAVAVTPAISVAIGVEGMAAAVSTSEAKSLSTAIDAGDGSDFIQNSAELAANATSVAVAVNVAVSPKSGAVAADAIWDGGTTAEATAKGIDADGGARSSSAETSLAVTGSGVTLDRHTSDSIASGSDTITNESKIGATAVAVAPAVSVAVSAKGAGIALSTATAKAAATSIDAGSGNDTITNTGELTATATGVAAAVNVAVTTGTGLALAGNPVWNGGTTSEAVAKGIDADGTGVSRASDTNLTIVSGKAIFEHQNSETGANGDDTITNLNKVDATATAVSAGLTGGVAVTGVSGAISTSTAKSEATSIDAGAGNDTINSSGDLTATATSVAASVNVAVVTGTGVAIAADALFDGGTTALATAKGIDADGTLANKTTGINITAESGGTSLNFSEALSAARGNDTITNDGKVGAVATAVAPSVSVAVAVSGAAVSASTATAKADATAIDAGGGDDSITNRGELNATATSVAASVNVSVTPGGLAAATDALWSGGTTADAVATGIHADGNKASTQLDATLAFNGGKPNLNFQTSLNPVTGNDTITNEAKIDTNATAVSGSIGVSVAVAGVAAAASTATATADATAINAGGGNDSITNKGELSSTAVAVAAAVVVSVTPAGVALAADAVWDGGTTAQAKATGISADGNAQSARGETTISTHDIRNKTIVESVSGNDTIVNEAKIDAMAVAVSPAVDVAVAVAGVSAAVANSTAKAAATAIDAGGGNDSITNKGELTATSVANADTLNVSVSVTGVGVAGNAVWDGGTTVEATATGIDADGKGGRITTERNINLSSDGITIVKRTTEESGSGNDVIVNEGKIVAQATAVPVSVAVGVAAYAGVGAAVSTSTAKSSASAIDAGGGADTVTNSGELQASATSTAVTVNGSFSLIGAGISADAVWDGGTTAEAKTVGIDADGQGSRLTTERTITTNGSGFNSDTQIDTESLDGNDSITNSGKITAHADANAPSVAVGLGGILGAAIATSTAKSQATAIAAGGGDDTVRNSSELTATAEATAIAVNVSVSVGAALSINDFWDGGNNADAIAKGIDAGDGNDTITTTARIEADATTKSPSVSVALSGIIGAAISSSTSKANATAIGAGVGDDTVDNSGELFAKADSSATTVNVSGSVWGAVSWDGGTTTEAKAKGIDAGDGKDTVANTARIQADATANTNSVNVSIGGFVGAAISTAKATAKATAIDAGEGDDTVINHGPLIADAKADADAVSVAATFGGGLAAAWDGGTTAEAISKGIDFGAGNDILTNDGFINATSTASTTSTGVGVNLLGGVAAAVARSTATARTTGVDGGDGDDDVGNSGILIVQADADAKGTSVSVAMIGAAAADTASNAIAQATGIDGGQGNDSISNNAPMTVIASATAKGTSVEVAVVGAAVPNPFLESGTKADATAIGLTGGAGTDTITNFSALTLSSTAKTDATAVSVGLIDFGGGSANVSAEANAKAIGIKGGADLDILENRGAIIASVTAEAPVRGVDVSLAGVANADFSTGADAAAYGMSGGEGDDEITNTNSGVIGLASTAKAPATGTSVNIFGVTEQSVGATATAISIGAEGGEGNDTITNAGIISANAAAEATVSGTSWTLAGKSTQQGISIGVAQATGISGGAGADIIVNSGGLVVGGTTTLKTEGSSTALFAFGGTTANASVNGSATAVGIDGGDDADEITNAGAIAVTAASNSSANGSSFTLTGSAKGNAGTTAAATGIGIGGGLGDDVIVITDSGVLSVTATTNATAENSAWTLAGASGGDAALQATSKSTGIAGNAGADQIYNDGKMATTATATLNVKGGSETIFGGAGSGSAIKASVNAIGIDGGDGSNWIENTNTITVTGISQMTSSTAAFSFTGSPADDALLTASSRATGISTGNDDDWIHNRAGGDISVLAQSQQTATGGSSSTVAGNAASSAASRGTASAVGIDGGGGNNSILNDGVVRADANPSGNVSNNSNAGFLFGSSGAASAINLTANSRGALSGDGVNSIINNGLIDARARSSGLAKSTANGADIVNGDTVASATATVNATAHGISAGEGNNQITNNKTINALADPAIKADAFSNGNGADGDGNATAKATVTATAVGIQVGGGNNQITNNDSITVSAKPSATADSFADSDAGGTARSTATATASATAIGIRAGKGDNDGDNLIINNGILSVAAEPTGNATAKATVDQISVCIPFTRICAVVQVGNKILNATSPESGTAIGIETGSGNDTIVNSGTITVTKTVEDVTTNGVAIRSGAGNDTVVLGNGSVTTGSIELGDGNDTLHLVGTPTVNGSISSGSGTNSLIFEGAGSFSNSLSGFVNTLKQGAGTFTVPSLPTMTGKLEVKEGTLQVNSNYQMAASSTFQTTVNGDGSHGQLKVGGTAGLDGALVVDKGPGTYVNGTTYDVVSANSVTGGFDSQQLPVPTALVSFSTNQTPTAFQVQANVAALSTVARNGVGASLARHLDQLTPTANSDLARVMGDFQQLSQRDFNRGFSSLSQERYQPFSAATLNTLQRYNGAVHTRMNIARAAFRGMPLAEAIDRTDLAQELALAQFGFTPLTFDLFDRSNSQEVRRRPGFWLSGFGNTMAHNEDGGFSGFNHRTQGIPVGFDFRLSDHFIAGVAATQSHGTLSFQNERGTGRSEGVFTTVYGSYFTDHAELEGMFSYGRDNYTNVREIALGNLNRRASSEHDGDVFSARFEGRYHFNLDNLKIEPFVSMQYSRLSIAGFRESGAGDLGLIVNQRSVDALASQVGLRLAHPLSFGAGLLIPELTAAWQHDFRVGDSSISASFRGASHERFRIAAPDDFGSALKLGGALTFVGNQRVSAAAGVNAVLGKDKPQASGLLQLQFRW